MRLELTEFNCGVCQSTGKRYRWDGECWLPSHYPTGANGWVKRCNDAGYDIEAMTLLFLAEVRISIPMRLAEAIAGAPYVEEWRIERMSFIGARALAAA